jgi:hypothetical protein
VHTRVGEDFPHRREVLAVGLFCLGQPDRTMSPPEPPLPNLLGFIADEDKEFQASLARDREPPGNVTVLLNDPQPSTSSIFLHSLRISWLRMP